MEKSYISKEGKNFVLSIVICAVIVGFLIALAEWFALQQSDLPYQLVLIALGAVLGILGKEIVSRWQEWHERKVRKEQNSKTDNFSDGDLQIEQMHVLALCTEGTPYTKYIHVVFTPGKPRKLPEEWEIISTTVLDHLIIEAKDQKADFSDGPQVDMVDARPERDPDRRVNEPNKIFVEVAPTSYFPFAAMSNRLDETVDGLGTTLRKRWANGQFIDLYGVKDLKSPAVIGTVTVVVTTDQLLAVHARSPRQHQVPGKASSKAKRVHFVGEGMLPTDCDDMGTLDPRVTARRALAHELGLDASILNKTEIIPTAFVFDAKRWQPVFCYIAKVPISFSELKSVLPTSKDHWETSNLIPFRFKINEPALPQLLLDRDPVLHLGSNHAEMALYAALVWGYGPIKVHLALNKGEGRHLQDM